MKRVVVTRAIPEAGLRLLRTNGIELWVSKHPRPLRRAELLYAVRGADAVITQLTDRVDTAFLKAAGPKLRIVANYAVGFDNIDLHALAKAKVRATNTPGILSEAVADHTFALLLAVARRITEADRFTRAGRFEGWAPDLLLGRPVHGRTLGIVGLGRIGRAVGERARGFGMTILYADRHRDRTFERAVRATKVTMARLLARSDFVTLHVPLTPKTHHLINAKALAHMKPSAVLINTSRGPVVNERALIRSVERGHLFGAGLDVFECEPEITCDVRSHWALAHLPSIVVTPHIASATIEARDAMAKTAANNVLAALAGRTPPDVVR